MLKLKLNDNQNLKRRLAKFEIFRNGVKSVGRAVISFMPCKRLSHAYYYSIRYTLVQTN